MRIKGFGKSDWFGFDARSSVPEGRDYRLDQILPFKRVHAREQGEVIVILHPAVQQTEFGERFELLGDNGLLGIGPENRSREI